MNIKETLKKNDTLRRIIKKAKIYRGFRNDAKDFSENYLEEAEKAGNHRYRILLLVHSLEKGLCVADPRPFGKEKALQLVELLKSCEDRKTFEYRAGIAALKAWCKAYEVQDWTSIEPYKTVKTFLKNKETDLAAGAIVYEKPDTSLESKSFVDVILARHSVREYEIRPIEEKDLQNAIKAFIAAPSACNRQMCRLYRAESESARAVLEKNLIGLGGFDRVTTTYFVITYDISAFENFGERNQGYFNAGLAAMNFANALHAQGIGSCFMQWANKRSEDNETRRVLGISKSERIAVVLGTGYYKNTSVSPASCRRDLEDIYHIV